jgi:hypothetical protein
VRSTSWVTLRFFDVPSVPECSKNTPFNRVAISWFLRTWGDRCNVLGTSWNTGTAVGFLALLPIVLNPKAPSRRGLFFCVSERSSAAHRHSSHVRRLSKLMVKGRFGRARMQCALLSISRTRICARNWGAQPVAEKLYEMNVRPTLREAALLQRMKFWLLRAKYGPLGNCSKSRGRKNYLALIRRHWALAERHGLRETDIF